MMNGYMKKAIASMLTIMMCIGITACGASESPAEVSEAVENAAEVSETTESPAEVSETTEIVEEASETVETSVDEPDTAAEPVEEAATTIEYLQGTWNTASMGYEYYGESQAEYYVRFTDTEIIYGHMKGDEFIPEYSDQIDSIEEPGDGRYRVLASNSKGQYSYQSSQSDSEELGGFDVLEYHWTWNEDEFPDSYSAGASLWKRK